MLLNPMLEIDDCQESEICSIYAAFFFPAFTFAHLFRCAAAIFLRADADMVRFTGADAVVFVFAGFDPLRAFDHLAF